jgi:hypothetical protein
MDSKFGWAKGYLTGTDQAPTGCGLLGLFGGLDNFVRGLCPPVVRAIFQILRISVISLMGQVPLFP